VVFQQFPQQGVPGEQTGSSGVIANRLGNSLQVSLTGGPVKVGLHLLIEC